MDAYKLHRHILCIDLKSFYASVECAVRKLDPFKTPLVVADAGRGGGSIVLAVSPYLKTLGIPSRLRFYELPEDIDMIVAKPRLGLYLEYSAKIIEIYLKFISEDDLYVYSVDEAFLNLTGIPNLREHGQYLRDVVNDHIGIPTGFGIAPTKVLAKVANHIAKKSTKCFRISSKRKTRCNY